LSGSSEISEIGTRELAHSSETWRIEDALMAGNIASYCRHSEPSVSFHFRLASMP
jgi:hypothetical protein